MLLPSPPYQVTPIVLTQDLLCAAGSFAIPQEKLPTALISAILFTPIVPPIQWHQDSPEKLKYCQ